jgi:hypothetical protein
MESPYCIYSPLMAFVICSEKLVSKSTNLTQWNLNKTQTGQSKHTSADGVSCIIEPMISFKLDIVSIHGFVYGSCLFLESIHEYIKHRNLHA